MSFQGFILKQVAKVKMKNVPAAQRDQILMLLEKDPALMKKIGDEIERRVKKGGEDQMKASMEVMKKYRSELAALMQ